MEQWKNGRVEEWKDGMVEEWKNVAIRPPIAIGATMEEWKNGRMEEWEIYHGDTENTEMEGNADCQLPYALRRLPTADWQLPTVPLSYCQLATGDCLLLPHAFSLLFALRSSLCALQNKDFVI